MPAKNIPPLVARPQRLRWVSWICAISIVVIFALIATALRGKTEGGGIFTTGDQIAMVGLGVLLGAAALLIARPRVWADERRVRIRNIVGELELPWQLVSTVDFDDRAPWAALELHDGDRIPVMAIQVVDRQRAVVAVRRLRELLAASEPL